WFLWSELFYYFDPPGSGGEWAMRSVDGGSTFAPAYRLHVVGGGSVYRAISLGQSPQGRPTLLGWVSGSLDLQAMPLYDPAPPSGSLLTAYSGAVQERTAAMPKPAAPPPISTPPTTSSTTPAPT